MAWAKQKLQSSQAAWKVVGNEVMIMNTKTGPTTYLGFDSWQGYHTEREELLAHIQQHAIKDVVFVTGDIHTFVAGDVRTQDSTGQTVAIEFVGGSITSAGLGETDLDLGGGVVIKGNDKNPSTPPAVIDGLKAFNPWVDAGRLRPPRLRPGDRLADELRLHAQADADDQVQVERGAADRRASTTRSRAASSRSRATAS